MSWSNVTRWLSEESSEEVELFAHCAEVCSACSAATGLLLATAAKWGPPARANQICARSYITSVADMQALDRTVEYLTKIVKAFYRLSPRLSRLKSDNDIVITKRDEITEILCSKRFMMLEVLHDVIITILNCCLHREDTRKLIEICFSFIALYNQLLGLSYKSFTSKFNICSNVCPNVLSLTKKISITKVVQVLAQSRAEINCHRLIDCLTHSYRPHHSRSDSESNSSTESLEIYHALTKHITPPASSVPQTLSTEKKRAAFIQRKKSHMRGFKSLVDVDDEDRSVARVLIGQNSDSDVPYTSLLNQDKETDRCDRDDGEILNGMLQSEEIYVEVLLDTAANMAPGMLGADGVKKHSSGEVRVNKKAAQKVMRYYQSVLWGEVGAYLEHIVLWWASCPLATRSPSTSQNLREWLMTFNCNNTPDLVLGALRILADALGCHVTLTSWDKLFGATLVTNVQATTIKHDPDISLNITECSETGANFVLVLHELVRLSNQCEVTGDYILGAPIDELPLVEQIPILHRLDHSIHTCRLWSLAETRKLANSWAMKDFFRIAHDDIQACLEQLVNLRFADHTVDLEGGKVGVHENVCGQMREKLVSEIKVNILKLKGASEEIVGVLASVCATISLAHLTMIFPSPECWRHAGRPPLPAHSAYVHHFLDRVFLPVVQATKDVISMNMILRIMCESWLHHIYVVKVKFSKEAAVQLLADFNEVRNWLNECKVLNDSTRKQILNNEVLRRCEGVGRLLLHTPGDLISMQDSTATAQAPHKHRKEEDTDISGQMMPAEMYVPNQEQWLTLRAGKMRAPHFCLVLCCAVLH